MHKRMEGILTEAEAIADLTAPGLEPSRATGQICTCGVRVTATWITPYKAKHRCDKTADNEFSQMEHHVHD